MKQKKKTKQESDEPKKSAFKGVRTQSWTRPQDVGYTDLYFCFRLIKQKGEQEKFLE